MEFYHVKHEGNPIYPGQDLSTNDQGGVDPNHLCTNSSGPGKPYVEFESCKGARIGEVEAVGGDSQQGVKVVSSVDTALASSEGAKPLNDTGFSKELCVRCNCIVNPIGHDIRCRVPPPPKKPWLDTAAWIGDAYLGAHVKSVIVGSGGVLNGALYASLVSNQNLSSLARALPPELVGSDFKPNGTSDKSIATSVEAAYAMSPSFRRSLLQNLLKQHNPRFDCFSDLSVMTTAHKLVESYPGMFRPSRHVHGFCWMMLFESEKYAEEVATIVGPFPRWSQVVRHLRGHQVASADCFVTIDKMVCHFTDAFHPSSSFVFGDPLDFDFLTGDCIVGGKKLMSVGSRVTRVVGVGWSTEVWRIYDELCTFVFRLRAQGMQSFCNGTLAIYLDKVAEAKNEEANEQKVVRVLRESVAGCVHCLSIISSVGLLSYIKIGRMMFSSVALEEVTETSSTDVSDDGIVTSDEEDVEGDMDVVISGEDVVHLDPR